MPKQNYFEKGQLTDLTYLVLAALTGPMHGYLIMERIEALTGGEFTIGPASLYTTLKKLTEAGFIRLVAETEGKKTYCITAEGLDALRIEIDKRERLARWGREALAAYGEENA